MYSRSVTTQGSDRKTEYNDNEKGRTQDIYMSCYHPSELRVHSSFGPTESKFHHGSSVRRAIVVFCALEKAGTATAFSFPLLHPPGLLFLLSRPEDLATSLRLDPSRSTSQLCVRGGNNPFRRPIPSRCRSGAIGVRRLQLTASSGSRVFHRFLRRGGIERQITRGEKCFSLCLSVGCSGFESQTKHLATHRRHELP